MSVASGKVISLRWAIPAFIGDSMAMRDMLLAKNTQQMLAAAGQLAVPLTYVVADKQGNIARKGTGFIPRRLRGDGAAPFPITDGVDNWHGRIAGDEMPVLLNPARDWGRQCQSPHRSRRLSPCVLDLFRPLLALSSLAGADDRKNHLGHSRSLANAVEQQEYVLRCGWRH